MILDLRKSTAPTVQCTMYNEHGTGTRNQNIRLNSQHFKEMVSRNVSIMSLLVEKKLNLNKVNSEMLLCKLLLLFCRSK